MTSDTVAVVLRYLDELLLARTGRLDKSREHLDAAVAGLHDGDVAWVAVTSVNAVDELVACAHVVLDEAD